MAFHSMASSCRLCHAEAELRNSHFIPKAYYRLLRWAEDRNPNPIVVSPSRAARTSSQVTDRLLCSACEERFNSGGESWVLRNAWRGENSFQIHAGLKKAA